MWTSGGEGRNSKEGREIQSTRWSDPSHCVRFSFMFLLSWCFAFSQCLTTTAFCTVWVGCWPPRKVHRWRKLRWMQKSLKIYRSLLSTLSSLINNHGLEEKSESVFVQARSCNIACSAFALLVLWTCLYSPWQYIIYVLFNSSYFSTCVFFILAICTFQGGPDNPDLETFVIIYRFLEVLQIKTKTCYWKSRIVFVHEIMRPEHFFSPGQIMIKKYW